MFWKKHQIESDEYLKLHKLILQTNTDIEDLKIKMMSLNRQLQRINGVVYQQKQQALAETPESLNPGDDPVYLNTGG